jgi:hypothetical protein
MLPVAAKLPVEESYNSVLAVIAASTTSVRPPAIKIMPLVSNVAVCAMRGVLMLPVAVKTPADCAITVGT